MSNRVSSLSWLGLRALTILLASMSAACGTSVDGCQLGGACAEPDAGARDARADDDDDDDDSHIDGGALFVDSGFVFDAGAAPLDAAIPVSDGPCPDETVLGQALDGCCVPGTDRCGVVNVLSSAGGCTQRENLPLLMLQPLRCAAIEDDAGSDDDGG